MYDLTRFDEASRAITEGIAEFALEPDHSGATLDERPDAEVCSPLEYACHVRREAHAGERMVGPPPRGAGVLLPSVRPPREVAEQAVGIVVHGKGHRIVIQQDSPGASAAISEPSESRARRIAFWVVAIATIVAAVAVVVVLFGPS